VSNVANVANVARGRETRVERRRAVKIWIWNLLVGIVFRIHRTARARDEGAVDA
jgi:hypothetical protein